MTARHELAPTGAAAALAETVAAAVPALETPRLRLRAPRIGDFDAWAGIACGPRGAHIGGPMSRATAWADFAQYVAGWMLHGHGGWAVEAKDDGTLLGFVLLGLEPGDEEPELGFLFTAVAEGRGLAREAAAAACAFGYDRLGLPSVVSYVDPGNRRAARLAAALGARRDPAAEVALCHAAHVYRHPAPESPR